MKWTFDKAPAWVKYWVFAGVLLICSALALWLSFKFWARPAPDGAWVHAIKFRGEPPMYVPWAAYVAYKLSIPVAAIVFLSGTAISYRYRDR